MEDTNPNRKDIQTHRCMCTDVCVGDPSAKQQIAMVDLSEGRFIGGSCSWVGVL